MNSTLDLNPLTALAARAGARLRHRPHDRSNAHPAQRWLRTRLHQMCGGL